MRTFAEATAEVAEKTVKVAESSFADGEVTVEEEEVVPDGCPICPCCSSSLDPVEFEQMKKDVARKFGKSIQTLLFHKEVCVHGE